MRELTMVAQASWELAPIIFMGPPLDGGAAFGVRAALLFPVRPAEEGGGGGAAAATAP